MTINNLTEQWKRGELPKGYYYAEDDGEELIIHIQGQNGSVMGDDFDLKATDWIKPIAPVPSFDEWQQMKAFCEEFNALSVAKENQKLKELLMDFVKRMEHYKEVKPDVGFIMFDLGYLANQVKEVLK